MDFDVDNLFGRRETHRRNRMVLGDVLERLTHSHPDRDAIIGWSGAYATPEFERLTYREADQAANRVANALLAEGLERGDRVLLYCENSVEAVVAMFGIAKAGLVVVPVNPMLAPEVLTWAIGHVGAKFAIVDAELWSKAAAAFADAGLSPQVSIPVGEDTVPGAVRFAEWIAGQSHEEAEVEIHADDIWSLMFTSGTTAMPKAAMINHTYAYLASYSYACSLTRGLRFEDDLRVCSFLPIIYHVGHHAVLFPAFLTGGTAVIGRRPDAAKLAAAITRERVTAVWAGSPRFLQMLVEVGERESDTVDLTSLTVAQFSWGAMRPDLAGRLKALAGQDLGMLEVFGQTESLSCYRFWPDQHPEKHEWAMQGVNYVGVPNPMLAARVVDEEGKSLRDKPGIAGEAVYRSPAIASGYFRNAEATEEAFAGGWFHSGDSCAYDEDGLQIMVDRFKDIVKSGGENVSSIRVESVIAQHEDVAAVAVIGAPDDRWGEVVVAVVVPTPGRTIEPAELIAFSRRRLAGYEAPKQVVFVDALPQTVGGKVLKYKLRQQFAELVRDTTSVS